MKISRIAMIVASLASSTAMGGAVVELVPHHSGPYERGSRLRVDVDIRSEEAVSHVLRGLQWDVSDTDETVEFVGNFQWYLSIGGFCDPLPCDQSEYPRPKWIVTPSIPPLPPVPTLPAFGTLRTGLMVIDLPLAPGDYLLDVFNRDDTNQDHGAFVTFGFGLTPGDPVTLWRADGTTQDMIRGGSLVLHVVPEPGSLFFLGINTVLSVGLRHRIGRDKREL